MLSGKHVRQVLAICLPGHHHRLVVMRAVMRAIIHSFRKIDVHQVQSMNVHLRFLGFAAPVVVVVRRTEPMGHWVTASTHFSD